MKCKQRNGEEQLSPEELPKDCSYWIDEIELLTLTELLKNH